MTRSTLTAVVAAVALPALGTGVAFGHAGVGERYPNPGASQKRVKTVRIHFSEPVITGRIVSVTGPGGTRSFRSSINKTRTVLTGRLSNWLGRGTYKVRWRVKADDGDTQAGSWSFRVR